MASGDQFRADADLILPGTGADAYTTGGTSLGNLVSFNIASIAMDTEMLSRVDLGSGYNNARIMGINLSLRFILSEFNSGWLSFVFGDRAVADTAFGLGAALPGELAVEAGLTKRLVVRPRSSPAPKAFLFLPRALVTAIGPVTYGKKPKLLDATAITVQALHDDAAGFDNPWYWGDQADFPLLA